MWKCKQCGCSDIIAEYSGDWVAYKKVIDKHGETEPIKESDKQDLGGYIYQYQCDECGSCSNDIDEIADWID